MTPERPTEPGWYWYKFGEKPWAIVRIERLARDGGRLYAACPDGPFYWLDQEENGWIEYVTGWVGPLVPPGE